MRTNTHLRHPRHRGGVLAAAALLAALAAATPALRAQYTAGSQLTSASLGGNSTYDGWTTALTAAANPGFPGFPGSAAWPATIGSSTAGSADAELAKLAYGTGGGPYPASSGLYYGGFSSAVNIDGGTLAVQDATPVAGLANIVFQVEIGEAWTWDFFNAELPVLSYTTDLGTVEGVAASVSLLVSQHDNGTVTMPSGDETVFINAYLLQWDLSAVTQPVTSFSISFTGVQHAQLYALQLDQSDSYTALAPVPEPSTWAALAGVAALGFAAWRHRRG